MASKLVFRKSGVSVSYCHALFAHWIVLQIHCSLRASLPVPTRNQGISYSLTSELWKVLPLVGWRNAAEVMKPQWETLLLKQRRPGPTSCRCSELP